MNATRVGAAAAAACLLAAGAAAGEPPKDTLRDDLAALVAWVPLQGRDVPPAGPSPTALTARIVAKGDAKIRPELKTLWRLATTEKTRASQCARGVEETVRFLYGTSDANEGALRLVEGAVVSFECKRGDYDFGSFDRKPTAKSAPSFDDLVKGGKLRAATKPQPAKVLALLGKGDIASWTESGKQALARAAGECSSGAAAAKLVEAAAQQPTDPLLGTALAWSGAPEAEAELRGRVASLAARVADGKEAAVPLLAAAAAGLAHVNQSALDEELGKLPAPAQRAAVAAAGTRLSLPFVLGRAESAAADARADALALVRSVIADGNGDFAPEDGARLVRWLDGASKDPALRDSALAAADALLYAFNRYPIHDSSGMNGIDEANEGQRVGAYPDIAVALGRFAEAVAKGGVAFRAGGDSLWDETAASSGGGWGDAAYSKIRSPHPNVGDAPSKSPVGLTGVFSAEGLVLTLMNQSGAPLEVDTTSLGWGCGEWVTTTIRKGGGAATSFTSLKLVLGFVRARVETPAANLTLLKPGGTFSWTVGVRDEHRAADHVSVESFPPDVTGKPLAAVLRGFGETWIK